MFKDLGTVYYLSYASTCSTYLSAVLHLRYGAISPQFRPQTLITMVLYRELIDGVIKLKNYNLSLEMRHVLLFQHISRHYKFKAFTHTSS